MRISDWSSDVCSSDLDSDIDPAGFDHYAFYEPRQQRIEMHLVSRAAQTVRIGRARHSFAAGESIHTENSCKYTLDGFRKLARGAGFRPAGVRSEERRVGKECVRTCRARW